MTLVNLNNIKEKLLSVGRFFRVVDEFHNQISIVNVACIVVVVKVALAVNPSMVDLGTLLIALLAHYGKKQANMKIKKLDAQQSKDIDNLKDKVKELADRVGSIAAALGFKNLKQ